MSPVVLRQSSSPLERYRAAFQARWRETDELTRLRRVALDEFLAAGFPTPRDERWKYTNLRRLETRVFAPAERGALAFDTAQPQWIDGAGLRIVFANGHFMPALSSPAAHPPGVTLLSLRQWIEHDPAAVASYVSQSMRDAGAFEHLNLAFCEDGVVLELGEGARLDQPIYVIHQWTDAAAGLMSHPRVIVRAGRNSRCSLIEHYLGPADAEYFTNAVTSFELAQGAQAEHYRVQQESPRAFHIGRIEVQLQRDARYSSWDIALGAGLGRTSIGAVLQGSGAHVALRGLFAPTGTQHLDTYTCIDHAAPHTTSEEEYRGIAGQRGRGVFNGKVIVRPGAQKIDARQSSRNLLLSTSAEIDAKPELEIYANDVKCSHGATTGQLDATSLFYLRSRGMSESDARALLIRAFAESVLTRVGIAPLRAHLEAELDARYATPAEIRS